MICAAALSEWDEPGFETEEIAEVGDYVIARMRVYGRGRPAESRSRLRSSTGRRFVMENHIDAWCARLRRKPFKL
jgi:hypothetical protein